MSLQILVDEDSQAKILVKKLRDTGYDVLTVAEAGLNGRADSIIFEYAKSTRRVLLTQNCADFLELHEADPDHHGILLVYKNSSPEKDMSVDQIVSSIANVQSSGIDLRKQVIALNLYRFG